MTLDAFAAFRALRGEDDIDGSDRKRKAIEMEECIEQEHLASDCYIEDERPCKKAKTANKNTKEQQTVIETKLSLEGIKYMEIQAYSGTGKSATLNEWIKADGDAVLDLLYNRGMADRASTEAEEDAISNMTAKTWHQLPFMFLMGKDKEGYKLASKGNSSGSDKATDVDNSFKSRFAVWIKKQRGLLPALSIEQEHTFWAFILSTLRSFAKSARLVIDDKDMHHLFKMHSKHKHILIERASQPTPPKGHRPLKWLPVPQDVKRVSQAVMTAILDRQLLEINFDIALKLVHLKGIKLDSRWKKIAMDEAQDLTEVMLEIIKNQIERCCLIAVGDVRQTINQWNNTCNGMKLLREFYKPHQRVLLHLTETFRFSQELADAVNWLFQCFDPLEKPLISNVKEKTQLLLAPTDHTKLVVEIMNEIKQAPERRIGVVSRTKSEAVELIENFISVTDACNLTDPTQSRLKFSCCGSIKTALQTIVKLAQMTDQQLHFELTKAEENENLERIDTIESLLQRKHRKRYAIQLQTIMGFQTSQEQCNVFITTGHSAKGDQFDVTFILGDFERTLQQMIDDKKQYDEEIKQQLKGTIIVKDAALTALEVASTTTKLKFEADTPNLNLLYVAISRARRKLYLPPTLHNFFIKKTIDAPSHISPSQQMTLESCWKLPQN